MRRPSHADLPQTPSFAPLIDRVASVVSVKAPREDGEAEREMDLPDRKFFKQFGVLMAAAPNIMTWAKAPALCSADGYIVATTRCAEGQDRQRHRGMARRDARLLAPTPADLALIKVSEAAIILRRVLEEQPRLAVGRESAILRPRRHGDCGHRISAEGRDIGRARASCR